MITSYAYIADDIQILQGGKPVAFGLYPDHVLVLNVPPGMPSKINDATPAALNGLSILITIVGLEPGERTVTPSLLLPNGKQGPQQIVPMQLLVKPGGAANLTFRFTPFVVPQAGKYVLKVPIDGEEVTFTFEVRIVQPEPAAIAA